MQAGHVHAGSLAESAKWEAAVELLSAALRSGNEAVGAALLPLMEELAKAVSDSPLQMADVFLLAAYLASMVDPALDLEGEAPPPGLLPCSPVSSTLPAGGPRSNGNEEELGRTPQARLMRR